VPLAVSLLENSVSRVESWSIPVPSRCRPVRAIETLKGIPAGPPTNPSAPQDQLLFEALRLAFELYTGLFGSDAAPSALMRKAIEKALTGPDLPRPDHKNTHLDYQFELYIYGLLSAGGCK
jgi:hypothetical protein